MDNRNKAPNRLSRLTLLVIIVLSTTALGISALLGMWAKKPLGPDVVAVVNGDVLTWADLQRVQVDIAMLQRQLNEPPFPEDELADLALQNLIERRLLLQEAARRGLKVDDDEFDNALIELRARFPDLKSLGAWMGERGLTDPTLIETIHGDLLVKQVREALVNEVTVSQNQVSDYFDAHGDDLQIGEEVRLRIIAIGSKEAAGKVLQALQEGANFSQLARQVSVGALASTGGDTGWVDIVSLPLPVREALAMLKEGEAAGPLEKDADQFLVVALAGRRPVLARTLNDARPAIEHHLLSEKRAGAVDNWLDKQQANAKIEVIYNAVREQT